MVRGINTKDVKDIIRLGGKAETFLSFRNSLKVKYRLTDDILEVNPYDTYLWEYYKLFKYSSIIRQEVREHVVEGLTYEQVYGKYRAATPESYRTMIYKEIQKLGAEIVINPLELIYGLEDITEDHILTIQRLHEKYPPIMDYSNNSLGVDLDFSKGIVDRDFINSISDDEFEELIKIIRHKSPNYRKVLNTSITPELIGYIELLLVKDENDLTSKQRERKIKLIEDLYLNVDI